MGRRSKWSVFVYLFAKPTKVGSSVTTEGITVEATGEEQAMREAERVVRSQRSGLEPVALEASRVKGA